MTHTIRLMALQLCAAAALLLTGGHAAALTTGQLNTVCTAVKADATANAARLAGDTVALLQWLNGARTPTALAWRAVVPPQESDEAANYTSYDTLAQGKRDSWAIFLMFSRNYGKNKVRNTVVDVWGAAIAGSVSEAILQTGTTSATNTQHAIGGTSKTTGTVTATDYNFDGAALQSDANWLVNPANCQG